MSCLETVVSLGRKSPLGNQRALLRVYIVTDTDKIEMKNGIKINGKQNLNQIIEDYE